ncbi:His Kinase A (phospho-acceptor) domain-containing protein [Reichenbachiella faecimaris]|uniref:histidine kinase n=1 Tax=Reichenbachiella faecimaris TaxID=692418 RepID=A0A1W2GE16_REIFA|nr:HAMP domain-containing sensor histidine kinase [Reichenbachiella faecimaris]SMD34897.1 His Kinase A (phospho-acceptor) domain-containing protein [Reichenbachiella faecimaris]
MTVLYVFADVKKNKLWGLVACLVVVLISLLVFQIQWLLTSAQLKEDQFRHRVTLALCSAVEELGKDKRVCSALASCSVKQGGGLVEFVGVHNGHRIESTVDRYLQFYKIDIPFDVTLSKSEAKADVGYVQAKMPNMENASIHIDFPSRQDFILSELNGMFVTSFLLIAILIVICGITLKWLFRQQQIQLDTVDYIDAVSHELKTPINNISLALTMLGKQIDEGKTEKVNYYMDVAKSENESLKNRINEVLGMGSLERILGNQKDEICDIHELIEIAHSRMSVKKEELKASIVMDLQAQNSQIRGDYKELLNVLICLIDNALTYAVKEPLVLIETSNANGQIRISIRDNGVGIPEELHDQVFEKYFRNEEDESGHGVGLFLVKKIIQLHGGDIVLQSSSADGSKFTIQLPMTK